MPSTINWFPGHMKKAIDNIKNKLPIADFIVEVLDIRAPLSSSNPIFQNIIQNKLKLIILNKYDLSDKNISNNWIEYYKKNNIPFIFTYKNDKNFINKFHVAIKSLTRELSAKKIKKGITNYTYTGFIMGVPNVGKSTIINKLSKSKSAKVGYKPGVTKGAQIIKINNNIQIFDTPGILWPKFENINTGIKLAMLNCIKLEVLPLETILEGIIEFLKIDYPNYLDIYNKDNLTIIDSIKLFYNNSSFENSMILFLKDLNLGKYKNMSFEKPKNE